MGKIRIVVVDDHEVVRQGLRSSLGLEPDMEAVGEARTGAEAVRLAAAARPDVMLLDFKLEDMDGPEVCRRVLAVAPRTAVVILTSYLQDPMILRSLAAGARGYVLKDVELAELKKMIRSVHRGHTALDPKAASRVVAAQAGPPRGRGGRRASRPDGTTLSETDMAILRGLSEGLTNKEIAARVHLSPHTIKDHVEKISATLGARSRAEIVAQAFRTGLLLPS